MKAGRKSGFFSPPQLPPLNVLFVSKIFNFQHLSAKKDLRK
jgi:hypothetical protein